MTIEKHHVSKGDTSSNGCVSIVVFGFQGGFSCMFEYTQKNLGWPSKWSFLPPEKVTLLLLRSLSAASRRHALKFIVMKMFLGVTDGFVVNSLRYDKPKNVWFLLKLPVFFQGKNESLLKNKQEREKGPHQKSVGWRNGIPSDFVYVKMMDCC